jgi:high-affinity Fe2+/Pb2+ permease
MNFSSAIRYMFLGTVETSIPISSTQDSLDVVDVAELSTEPSESRNKILLLFSWTVVICIIICVVSYIIFAWNGKEIPCALKEFLFSMISSLASGVLTVMVGNSPSRS